jgi:uncharacterized membrane protein YfcA
MLTLPLLFAAGFVGGTMNAIAGGGSFVTFPALVFAGLPSVVANATSTVALFPGALSSMWAFRRDLVPIAGVSLRLMTVVSLIGGLIGGILLLATPQSAFDVVIPFLLLLAALTFAYGGRAGAALRKRVRIGAAVLLPVQLVLSIYGGYFGGAVGLMTMAAWSLLDRIELKALNPAKVLTVGAANSIAIVTFIVAGKVAWVPAVAMLLGGAAGGYFGAHAGRRLPAVTVRRIVLGVTVVVTAWFFWRAFF